MRRMTVSRRRPWLAALLSLVMPGVGQLYSGCGRRGAFFLVMVPLWIVVPLILAVTIPTAPWNMLLPLVLYLGLHVYAAIDAARCARARDAEQPLPRYSRWFVWIPIWLFMTTVVGRTWVTFGTSPWIRAFRIPAGSMEPTLLIGDCLFAVNWPYNLRNPLTGAVLVTRRDPARGDLITLLYPEDPSRYFIKRVVGLPGETLEIKGRTVYVNSAGLTEPYAQFNAPEAAREDYVWGPERVPADHFFVLGDNRDNSRDSRFWGFLPRENVVGRAVVVYWSRDPRTGAIRWHRFGHRLH
jgi:signal peptidase I